MVTIYQYLPAWTVPCISPFATKVMYYMRMTGIPYRAVQQDLTRLDRDTPLGKLPVIDDGGVVVADSTAIINHFRRTRGDVLDADASPRERAVMQAFNRLLDEHLYWPAVVQPRWRETAGWERYLRVIAGSDQVDPGLRAFADDFRFRILSAFMHGGWGRMDAAAVYARGCEDVDSLAAQLGDQPFFMGGQPRSIDAAVLAMLRQIVDSPFDTPLQRHAAGHGALRRYMDRMRERFDL